MSRRLSSSRSGSSAARASTARRACSRSLTSGASFPNASDASSEHVWTRRAPTFALRSSSISASALTSASDSVTGSHLLSEDLFHRPALLVSRDLPLRGVSLGNRKPAACAELVRHGLHPLEQLLDPCTRRNRRAALEVEELAGETPAQRAPEVLLEQPVRPRRERLALVERTRDACGERIDERRERARLREL